jgi:hypothetical protein
MTTKTEKRKALKNKVISQQSIQATKLLNTDKSKDVFSPIEILKESEKISSNIETKEINNKDVQTIFADETKTDKQKLNELEIYLQKKSKVNIANNISRKFKNCDYSKSKDEQKKFRNSVRKVLTNISNDYFQLCQLEKNNPKQKQTEAKKNLQSVLFLFIAKEYNLQLDEIKNDTSKLFNASNKRIISDLNELLNLKF